jgi:hypothetical protein
MFEKRNIVAVDPNREIYIRFSYRTNPFVGTDEANIGNYEDKRAGISFDFDCIQFNNFAWSPHPKSGPEYSFQYLFLDQISARYKEEVLKQHPELAAEEFETQLQSDFIAAFHVFDGTADEENSKLKPIRRLSFLNSGGFLIPYIPRPGMEKYAKKIAPFSTIKIDLIRQLFETDLSNTLRELK